MATMVGLTGVGIAVAVLVQPTSGQVSVANSGGLWTGVVTALFLVAAGGDDTKAFFGIETAVTGAGILTSAILSRNLSVSQGRVLLIDSGGILGGLLGAAAIALASTDGKAVAVGAGVGALAGLGLTTYITQNFDGPDTNTPQVAMAPAVLGRGAAGGSPRRALLSPESSRLSLEKDAISSYERVPRWTPPPPPRLPRLPCTT